MVPGVGLDPRLFPNSFDISCPFIGFFERSQSVWNDSKPRISQQSGSSGQQLSLMV
jgi:hypothetical protein